MRRAAPTAILGRPPRIPAVLPVASRLATTVAVVAAVAACAMDGADTSADPNGSREDSGFYREPPEVRLSADDKVQGALAYRAWINDGVWRKDQVGLPADGLPLARLHPSSPLVFELAAVSLPAWVDLSIFTGIAADGQPVGESERFSCVPVADRTQCSVDLAKDQRILRITARPARAGQFAALNMGWHRSVASDDSSLAPEFPSEVSATWAFAVSWTPEPAG